VQLLHALAKTSAEFDDPNLVSHAGLVPVMALAGRAGLPDLVAEHVTPGGECAVNARLKVPALVAGMAAGADSIDDMDVLRHGAMSTLFGGIRAPSTLGSHLRCYTWGNVSQLEKAGRGFLARLAREAPLLPGREVLAFVDIDSMQKRVYGHAKQGAKFGHTKIQGKSVLVRGLNALAATISTPIAAPVIAATRLRGGTPPPPAARPASPPRLSLPRGTAAARNDHRPDGLRLLQLERDRRDPPPGRPVLRHRPRELQRPRRDRRDSRRRLDRHQVPAGDLDDQLDCWISDAEVAETGYTAFASKKERAVTARLIVRRVRDQNKKAAHGQGELFPVWRHHAVFTDSPFELVISSLS